MGTITNTEQLRMEKFAQLGTRHNHNTGQQCMDRSPQKLMKLDQMTQPGWEDAAHYFRETDNKYSMSELMIAAIIQRQTEDHTAAPVETKFGQLMECLEIIPEHRKCHKGLLDQEQVKLC
jgi:hypothetical protein